MDVGLHEDELDDIIEKPINRVKSVEELRSHTIDENLNDFGKEIILLTSNYEAQLLVGIKKIPNLLQVDKQQCIHKMFPQFKESCFLDELNRSMEFYQTLNDTLINMLSSELLTPKEFSCHFIELITNKIFFYSEKPSDYENSEIYKNWSDLMFKSIDYLPENIIKSSIFDLIPRAKLQYSSRRTREYLSYLLAKCAPKLSPQTVSDQLFPLLINLCNDTQYEVRAIACRCLSVVARALGSNQTMDMVVPEMFKYLCDESTLVRTSCFQSLVEILDLFDDYDTKCYLLKKIQSFIEYGLSVRDENYLLSISKNLAPVINSFNDIMSTQTKLFFVDVFFQLCKNENLFSKRSLNESKYNWNMCKINLANSFSSVITITNSVNFENKLSQCLTSLVKDKNENVREAIVLKLIEIANGLGPSQHHLIINDFCTSLTDESALVISASTNNLEKFLKLFIKKDSNGFLNETQQMPGHQLVLKRLIELEKTISAGYKYSTHCLILESFALLPWLISTELLADKILPILDLRINARALPVRQTSVKTMLIILRKIPKYQIRVFYINKLIEYSTQKSCYKRIFFIEICKLVIQLYSKNFFKTYFYQPVIHLAQDPVVNVRISFIKLLVDLKKIWRFHNDREKLDQLEIISKTLLHDNDKDVFELAQKAIVQMDFIKSYTNNDQEDRINRIKEEEENYWFELEPKKMKSESKLNNGSKNEKTDQSEKNSAKANASRAPTRLNKSNLNSTNTSKTPQKQEQNIQTQSLFELNAKICQIEPTIKRSEKPSLSAEKPKVKPLQPRRNSINSELMNASTSSGNSLNNKNLLSSTLPRKK